MLDVLGIAQRWLQIQNTRMQGMHVGIATDWAFIFECLYFVRVFRVTNWNVKVWIHVHFHYW